MDNSKKHLLEQSPEKEPRLLYSSAAVALGHKAEALPNDTIGIFGSSTNKIKENKPSVIGVIVFNSTLFEINYFLVPKNIEKSIYLFKDGKLDTSKKVSTTHFYQEIDQSELISCYMINEKNALLFEVFDFNNTKDLSLEQVKNSIEFINGLRSMAHEKMWSLQK